MLRKLTFPLVAIAYTLVAIFAFAGIVRASATDVHISLEQPQSPTNNNNLNLGFTTLDIQGRTLTVRCFKKGPSNGSFSQFGPDITITPDGGNNGVCTITPAIMGSNGTYQFYATADASGADLATSSTVSVDYSTSGPGTPTSYSKEQTSSCSFKIKFHTADDSGKTVRVELYRSDQTSFTLDNSTKVGSLSIGSNLDGEITNTVPDCSKTYYYAIRAFDSADNGSGAIGDTNITIVNTTTTQTTTTPGAIPVAGTNRQGTVLGAKTTASTTGGSVLGTATPSPLETSAPAGTPEPTAAKPTSTKTMIIIIGLLGLLGLGFYLYRQSKD